LEEIEFQKNTSFSDSAKDRSNSDMATKNIIDVTLEKQWIHFLLSVRWPATSTNLCCVVRFNWSY